MNDHTFVICAYKECHYLEELIESLLAQTVKSDIIIETSTPNEFIQSIASKYEIPVYANPGKGGITEDWNYGYSIADTPFVTIAHQDDTYRPEYTETMLRAMKQSERPLIFFTNYAEIRNGEVVENNRLLRVKRMMLHPMRDYRFRSSIWMRRRILSFGDPILCPSVTFAKKNLPEQIFENHFLASEDWEAWEKLSKLQGDFLYDSHILMCHRIHPDSTTTLAVRTHAREREDYEMYRRFWPDWMAKILVHFYSKSEDSNNV